jgi:hypothetical protein
MTERITSEREMVKEFTTKAGESNNTWIANQVRLKAQLVKTHYLGSEM